MRVRMVEIILMVAVVNKFFILQRKKSAHERQWEKVKSGEWSSGKKWADDAPQEVIDADSVTLISSGAAGAFVHGLEDEFMGMAY